MSDVPEIKLNLVLSFGDKDFTTEYIIIVCLIVTTNIYLLLHILDFIFYKGFQVYKTYTNRSLHIQI